MTTLRLTWVQSALPGEYNMLSLFPFFKSWMIFTANLLISGFLWFRDEWVVVSSVAVANADASAFLQQKQPICTCLRSSASFNFFSINSWEMERSLGGELEETGRGLSAAAGFRITSNASPPDLALGLSATTRTYMHNLSLSECRAHAYCWYQIKYSEKNSKQYRKF